MNHLHPIRIVALVAFFFISSNSLAQDTWQTIYTIMQTNCTGTSCHNEGPPKPFKVDSTVTAASLYDTLLNAGIVNPYAKNNTDNKLVYPGEPTKSFLMRKLSHCPNGPLSLTLIIAGTDTVPVEGYSMPDAEHGAPPLPENERELILSWILAGAPETGVVSPDSIAGNICDVYSSIRVLPASRISLELSPNPASSEVTIRYTLEKPEPVRIEVLDVSGKVINSLLFENQAAGQQINPLKLDTEKGVYFIRLTIGEAQYIRKLVKA